MPTDEYYRDQLKLAALEGRESDIKRLELQREQAIKDANRNWSNKLGTAKPLSKGVLQKKFQEIRIDESRLRDENTRLIQQVKNLQVLEQVRRPSRTLGRQEPTEQERLVNRDYNERIQRLLNDILRGVGSKRVVSVPENPSLEEEAAAQGFGPFEPVVFPADFEDESPVPKQKEAPKPKEPEHPGLIQRIADKVGLGRRIKA